MTYTVEDTEGGTDTATLEVRVIGVNDGPAAVDDFGRTSSGIIRTVANDAVGVVITNTDNSTMTVNADLLLNDSDPEGDTLRITGVKGYTEAEVNGVHTTPQNVAAGAETYGKNGGKFTIRPNGSWEFDPDGDFNDLAEGATRDTTVEYIVSESGITDTATLTVTVIKRNLAPEATDDVGATMERTTITVADGATGTTDTATDGADLLLNDSDPEAGTLTITAVKGYTREADGTYKAQEVAVAVPDDGSTETFGDKGGKFTIEADGSWSFDPGTDFVDLGAGDIRTTEVVYTTSDGKLTDTAKLTVTVSGANQAPEAVDDQGTTLRNRVLTVANDAAGVLGGLNADLLLNDEDVDSDILTISAVNGATASVGKAIDGSNGGSFTLNKNGSWEFDPDGDFDDLAADATRTTTVTYTVSDGRVDSANTATLTVTVVGRTTNTAPTAGDDIGRTNKGTVLTVKADDGSTIIPRNAGLLLNDSDPDDDKIGITGVGDAPNTITVAGLGRAVEGTKGGKFTINADGSYTFDPDGKFNLNPGSSRETKVAYRVADAHGGFSTATLTVTVTGSHAPEAKDDFGATSEGSTINVSDGHAGITRTSDGATVNRDLLLNDRDNDGDRLRISGVIGYTAAADDGTRQSQNVGVGGPDPRQQRRPLHHPGRWRLALRPRRGL